MLVNPVQRENASSPIWVMLSGSEMLLSLVQSANALLPITVTPSEIVMLVRSLHF